MSAEDDYEAARLVMPEEGARRYVEARRMHRIFDEIAAERARQDRLHPETDNVPDGTGGGGRETWRNIATHACDRATREGRLTFAHVLDEEQAEVLAETDPVKLRAELLQCAAVCVRWVQRLDRDREAGR